ncbi:hypothetical protein J6590_098255 [Homalodisca vitripennis]|nr:hypothetical protein J6590_098255 [Homalodisca vitripennis]
MIDVCHCVGTKDNPSRPHGIIVKFVRRTDKERLINKRREEMQELSTKQFGLAVDKPIFVNESLSPARRRLLGQAQEVKKTRNINYLWLRGGNILMRVIDGSPKITLSNELAELRAHSEMRK